MKKADLYYTGTVVEVTDPVLYEILVDIPGIVKGVKAFPVRGELDEPRVGDFVLLRCFDPVFQSYYLWQKIKENDFIGFRSNGKMVDITPDYVKVCIFDPTLEYNDLPDSEYRPEPTDWIKLDKDGNLEISLRANRTITIAGNSETNITGTKTETVTGAVSQEYEGGLKINITGDCSITASENCNITATKDCTVKGKNVTITGGKATMKGMVAAGTGPFCAIPTCPFSGAPHGGSEVSGT